MSDLSINQQGVLEYGGQSSTKGLDRDECMDELVVFFSDWIF